MENTLKRTIQLILCFFIITPASVQAATSNGSETSGMGPYVFLGAIVLGSCAYGLIKLGRKLFLERKMSALYETLSSEEIAEMFPDDKRHFYFVGEILSKVFPKGDVRELFSKYMDLHKVYTNLGKDVYKAFCYAKDSFIDFDEENVYSMLAVVMMNAGGISDYEECSAERIAPARRKAKTIVKSVETIARHDEIFSVQPEKELGTKDNAILVAGTSGIQEYFDSMIAEDGTTLDYDHKGTLYVRDKELDIEYDLRKYTLKDEKTDAEICSLWFNPYGMKNCEQCIEGFVMKKDIPEGIIQFAEEDTVNADERLKTPDDVQVSNVVTTGKPKITWSAVEGADKYFIYRAISRSDIYVYQGSSVDTEFTDVRAQAGIRYSYKVKAADTTNKFVISENSDFCYIVCDLPCPVVTAGNDVTTGYVQLTWPSIEGALRYEIYRATTPDGEFRKMNSQKSTTYVNDALVELGATYYYKVRAIHSNSYGNSADSEVVTGIPNPVEQEILIETDENKGLEA